MNIKMIIGIFYVPEAFSSGSVSLWAKHFLRHFL